MLSTLALPLLPAQPLRITWETLKNPNVQATLQINYFNLSRGRTQTSALPQCWGGGLGFCIFKKLPGDAHAAGLRTSIREAKF